MRSINPHSRGHDGFALVTVILVLAALLLLCTPFLLTARNADQASQQLFHQAQARIALDNASTHARAILQRSHPSRDGSLYSDSLEELRIRTGFPEGFLDPHDAEGVMWDVRSADVAGKIDLGSAPPQVFAAMLGSASRIVKPLDKEESKEIPLSSTKGLDPSGHVWIGGELIHYGKIEGNTLMDLERGVGARYDAEDNPLPGPKPPIAHGIGSNVIEQRAMAPVEWRLFEGDVREFDSMEQFQEANLYTLPKEGFRTEHYDAIERMGSPYGGVAAGSRWQRAARMVSSAEAEVDDNLQVDSARWFSQGSTILIRGRGTGEMAVVREVSGGGTIYLDRALQFDYDAYEAEVSVLSRRPVNINTASTEVLEVLMTNLKLKGRNERITGGEARQLAELIDESRPFDGLEDFMERIVLPAAGIEPLPNDAPVVPDAFASGATGGLISPFDGVALFRNALNANDIALEFSTMPFCFTSNNVYDLTLRAVINASSGVERFSAEREETQVAIPQEELTHVWATQKDYDDMLRLGREAPYWSTGPEATSRHDPAGSQPPTRMWAYLGTYEGEVYVPGVAVSQQTAQLEDAPTPEHIYPQVGSADGYAQLFHTQVDESADPEKQGRMLHFTHETEDPEGHYLPSGTKTFTPDDPMVRWDPQGTGLLRGFEFSCWVKPRSLADAHLLDVGGSSLDADRVSLLFESGDLVLRYLDAGGDHQDTPGFRESTELRYALGNDGTSPGLPVDVWSHIQVDVRGSRPSQMMMLVNGLAHGVRSLGLTRLTAALSDTGSTIQVESTEGFPPRGVVRIGDELIEYTLGSGTLEAAFIATGPDAGFGGRNARTRWTIEDQPTPFNLGALDMNHPLDAQVELYGYALMLVQDTTAGQSAMSDSLGIFRVGVVNSVEGTGNEFGEQISVLGTFGAFPIGTGIRPNAGITGLNLGVAETPDDENADVGAVMEAFNKSGGYACLMQARFGPDSDGIQIGGWEVVRYSGWTGTTLDVVAWGDGVPELNNLPLMPNNSNDGGGRRTFVVRWGAVTIGGIPATDIHTGRLFVMPISLAVPGGTNAFLQPAAGVPQYAQITELGSGDMTEWVAYNTIVNSAGGQLVRDDPQALDEARLMVIGARVEELPDDPGPGGGGGGTGGGGTGGTGGQSIAGPSMAMSAPPATSSPAAVPLLGSQWESKLGEMEDEDFVISRSVREAFQFRGVLGTFSHAHATGTPVLPVFRASDSGLNAGRPGRFDPVFLVEANFNHLGWPVTVYRGYLAPPDQERHTWVAGQTPADAPSLGPASLISTVGSANHSYYFTLNSAAPAPVAAGSFAGIAGTVDSRAIGRVLSFPSGERARDVRTVTVGSAFDGSSIADVLVDEVAFGATEFGMRTAGISDPESVQAAQLVLEEDFPETSGASVINVFGSAIRLPMDTIGSVYDYLGDLDSDGGLVRIGEEILAYESLDIPAGKLTVAVAGRGLLGTSEGNHELGSNVTFLDSFNVAILSGGVGPTDATLPVGSTSEFPREGTVLIGRELIHYTRIANGGLDMPRSSKEAGRMDGRGDGIFRGRYGTIPESHSAGEPVILFPMRYWDRWADQVDGPELAYFGIEINQPAAFWKQFSWSEQGVGLSGVGLGILMRTDRDVPWDADPDATDGLELFHSGEGDVETWIGHQSPGVEWRVFVEYTAGAFDAETGMGHAWRTSPRLDNFIVDYLGPAMTLRSVER
ncbi:MAG: hypothetical protein ACI9F9_000135 [Candidatus Paceibacteria bacterium]|jgi:hypothetical protein